MRGVGVSRRVVLPLGTAIILFANYAGSVGAQNVDPGTRQACSADAMRLCGAFIPDVEKITNCMTERFREVSPECRVAMLHEDRKTLARTATVHEHHKTPVRLHARRSLSQEYYY